MAEKIYNKISIIVPVWNEEGNILQLVQRIDQSIYHNNIEYEIIFIDDNSTDKTRHIIELLSQNYPIKYFKKLGKKGKATSLIEGFTYTKFELICMIDSDLQYPPEAIPEMIQKVNHGIDIVLANRKTFKDPWIKKICSQTFSLILGKLLHGMNYDIQTGLKIFKKEITERIQLEGSSWAFDLTFLKGAINAGYKIDTTDIIFSQRHTGKAKINLIKAAVELTINAIKLKLKTPEIIPLHINTQVIKGHGFHYKGKEYITHNNLNQTESALNTTTRIQKTVIISTFLLLLAFTINNWHTTMLTMIAVITIFYFLDLLFNFYLILKSFTQKIEITIQEEEINQIENWPNYTILCPLYKESDILGQFTKAIQELDYPKEKLQVLLLLEEDDTQTISQAYDEKLPNYFEITIVPNSIPKTKPKACNYGLKLAKGEYIVIYDAEDIPEKNQLKKAVLAFNKSGENILCLQAKLNFYNSYQNLITRIFAAEYALWFDLVLTGLQSISAPIPLGGTSNHFRTQQIQQLKGWDAFNVTEDADLGIRLAKQGYQTAILNSTTYEEANSQIRNWINQRSRWIKGYMQTYLVHNRKKRATNKWGRKENLIFQLIIGGKILSMLINPLMWAITIVYFTLHAKLALFIESFFPTPILYMGVFSFIFGNFLYLYYYSIGSLKRGYYDLPKYTFFVPLYWLAMSYAAYQALLQLITKPHYWSKTKHGLHLNKTTIAINPTNRPEARIIPA